MRLMITVIVLVVLVIIDQTQFHVSTLRKRPDCSKAFLLDWGCSYAAARGIIEICDRPPTQ
jgi:hypothetical protein